MNQFIQDFKFSLRLLRGTPGLTLTAIVVLVLGMSLYLTARQITVNTLDMPLPFENGDRFVALKTTHASTSVEYYETNYNAFAFYHIADNADSFSDIAAYQFSQMSISDGERSMRFPGSYIQPKLLAMTKTAPVLGRTFTEEDGLPGSQPVVLISFKAWQDYYAGDSNVIGKNTRVNGEPHTIIGVMPEGFNFPVIHDVWLPLHLPRSAPASESYSLAITAILKPNINNEQATVEVNRLMSQLIEQYPKDYGLRTERVATYANILTQSPGSHIIFTASGAIILFLAVINLGILLFIRALSRRQELSIRNALGASTGNVVRQVLIESGVICLLGFITSIALTAIMLKIAQVQIVASNAGNPFGSPDLPMWFRYSVTGTLTVHALILLTVIWIATGLVVCFQASDQNNTGVLGSVNKGSSRQQSNWATKFIVSLEVVLSTFLLITIGTFIVTFSKLIDFDYGAKLEERFVMSFDLSTPSYQNTDDTKIFLTNLTDGVNNISGIENAAITTAPPGMFGINIGFSVEDFQLPANVQRLMHNAVWVDDNYFQSLNVLLVSGRYFDNADTADSQGVIIVDRQFAQWIWPNENALGKRIQVDPENNGKWLTIVGVIEGIHQMNALTNFTNYPAFYRPITQDSPKRFFLVAENKGRSVDSQLRRELIDVLSKTDRDIPLNHLATLKQLAGSGMGGTQSRVEMFMVMALGALLLACVGIYGVIARSVSLRKIEIGVRRALGSSPLQTLSVFLKQGAWFVGIGGIIGGGLSFVLLGGSLSSILPAQVVSSAFSLLPSIGLTVIAGVTLLIFLASYIPAQQALRQEPGDALRDE
jgi:predicted permease